jgi:hypothetical protein
LASRRQSLVDWEIREVPGRQAGEILAVVSNALLIKLVQTNCSYRYILSNLALGFIDPRYLRGIRWIEFNQANLELIIVVFLGPPVRE